MSRVWISRILCVAITALFSCGQAVGADSTLLPPSSSNAVFWSHVLNGTWVFETAIDLLLPIVLLCSRWGSRLAKWSERAAKGRLYLAFVVYGLAFLLLRGILRLPVEFVRHRLYPGRDPDTDLQWLVEQAQSLLLPALAIVLLLWLPVWLVRKSPRHWWLWLTACSVPVALIVLVLQPIWTSTHSAYKPLESGPLRTSIQAMASSCGVPNIPVMVGGDDTTVIGLGPTNRVILQKDLLKTETPDQVRFTVAHELKHYVMDDNWKALVIAVVLVLAGSLVVLALSDWLFRFRASHLGFYTLTDVRAFPLVVLCLTLFWLGVTPAFLAFNRHIEREADRFGLELTHENQAAAALFTSWLGELDLADPGVFANLTRSTHPSVAQRVAMARSYRPWDAGVPLKYGAICRASLYSERRR